MKKTFLLAVLVLALAFALISCNTTPSDSPEESENETAAVIPETSEETEAENTIVIPDTVFVKLFEAPEGDYREIAYKYMLDMANYKWVAGEDFAITWKNQGDFGK